MKWFKHISDSLDDPFIFDLITKHGADGYLVFFGILEIYAREFKPELSWKLSVTLPYLKQKFHKTHKQLITNPLQTISNSGKWEVLIDGDKVTVFIPKFKELLDEWTARKIGSKSGETPKILSTNTDKELDKDIKASFNMPVDKPDPIEKPSEPETDPSKPLKELFEKVMKKYPSRNWFTWIGTHNRAHPEAVIHTFKRLLDEKTKINGDPIVYADSIIKQESQNYNARDFYAEEKERLKDEPNPVTDLTKNIGKRI